jgi:hypothetical protein
MIETLSFVKELTEWFKKSDSTDEELIAIIEKYPRQVGKEQLVLAVKKEVNIKRRRQKIKQIQEKIIKEI